MPEANPYCQKCMDHTPHRVRADMTAFCKYCLTECDVNRPPARIEIRNWGKPERRV